MPQRSTTIRVSRRAHQIFCELAERRRTSVSDFLDGLAERERRHDILALYNTRVAALLADPTEREAWAQELAVAEVSTAETDLEQHARTVAR